MPANCRGFGRIHTFRRATSQGWPANPLPIDPAARALGLSHQDEMRVQVFQNAACNWRCWYCFVDFSLLSASRKHSDFITADQMIQWYAETPDRPPVIDLSGGQPDLVPEWVVWMIEALKRHGLSDKVFLWSDDNLSNDYFLRYLTDGQREHLANFRNYARVCCFKGFDPESFAFNTKAHPDLFKTQFAVFAQLLSAQIDLYAYVTLTGPRANKVRDKVQEFIDQLQGVHPNLPLRTIPLEIRLFSPVRDRIAEMPEGAQATQRAAIEAWNTEIALRFSSAERSLHISDVHIS